MNKDLSPGELIFFISILPFIIYFSGSIGTGLLLFVFLYIPVSAGVYLLRWFLTR